MVGNVGEAALVNAPEKIRKAALLGIHVVEGGRTAIGAHAFVPSGSGERQEPAHPDIALRRCGMSAEEASASRPKGVVEDKDKVDKEPIRRLGSLANQSMMQGMCPTWGEPKLPVEEEARTPRNYTMPVEMPDGIRALTTSLTFLTISTEVAGALKLRGPVILGVEVS